MPSPKVPTKRAGRPTWDREFKLPLAAEQNNLKWSDYDRVVPTTPTFYDFDGDGEAEAIVVTETTDDTLWQWGRSRPGTQSPRTSRVGNVPGRRVR